MHIFISNIPVNSLDLFLKPSVLPSDYHLINLRTLSDNQNSPSKNFAFILRRFAYDCNDNYDKLLSFEQVRILVFIYLRKIIWFFFIADI